MNHGGSIEANVGSRSEQPEEDMCMVRHVISRLVRRKVALCRGLCPSSVLANPTTTVNVTSDCRITYPGTRTFSPIELRPSLARLNPETALTRVYWQRKRVRWPALEGERCLLPHPDQPTNRRKRRASSNVVQTHPFMGRILCGPKQEEASASELHECLAYRYRSPSVRVCIILSHLRARERRHLRFSV